MAYLIYAFTNRFYSFSGLRQYKQKFNPIWSPRYVAYPRDTWLILDMLAIYRVDNRKVKRVIVITISFKQHMMTFELLYDCHSLSKGV